MNAPRPVDEGRRDQLGAVIEHQALEMFHRAIEWAALGIELLVVAVIVAAVIILATRRGTVRYLFHLGEPGAYESYKHQLARPLMLGLDLTVTGGGPVLR